jgi:hypothetical protein
LTGRRGAANVECVTRHVVLWLLLVARLAGADPRVVLVETGGAPELPALASQIELQAGRRVTVRAVAARQIDPMTYADQASQLVASGEASIVVWIAAVDRGYLVFAAGGWPGRALIELVRVDAELGAAEIERTIALKIAGLLDAMLAPRGGVGAVLRVGAIARSGWTIEAAGALAREPHERGYDGRAALGVSRAWSRDAWRVGPALTAYWQPSGTIDGPRGRATLTELGAAAAFDVGRNVGAVELVLRTRLVAAGLVSDGTSRDGRHGQVTVLTPYVGVEAGVQRAISETVSLGVAIGCDVALIHRELVIDDATIVDVGRARMHVGAVLLLSL